jgi:hypothetical protein
MALYEKKILKLKDIEGEDGLKHLMDAVNRTTESSYAAMNSDITIDDNLAMQKFTSTWTGTTYPSKKIDRNSIKGNPNGVQLVKITEDNIAKSFPNPAYTYENETIQITDINGIDPNKTYTATFLIL